MYIYDQFMFNNDTLHKQCKNNIKIHQTILHARSDILELLCQRIYLRNQYKIYQ